MRTESKDRLKQYLLSGDFDSIVKLYGKEKGIFRDLISLTYDREDLLCWRAIEAVGRLTAAMRMTDAREALERIIWMMKEESGGNAWSAPELAGEIILNNLDRFDYMIPILSSFHSEEMFTAGVLRSLSKLAVHAYKEVLPYRELAFIYLHHKNPVFRANALLVLKSLKDDTYADSVSKLLDDNADVTFYNGGHLARKSVGQIARETLSEIKN